MVGTDVTAQSGGSLLTPSEATDAWADAASQLRSVRIAALVYAVALLLFLVGPPLLSASAGFYPLMRWGEILDLLAPVAVIPFAWLLFRRVDPRPVPVAQTLAFLVLASLWVEGHSLHLAANAIGHHVSGEGAAAQLIYFLDEELGHVILHVAILGLSGLVAWRSLRVPVAPHIGSSVGWAILVAAAVYGITFFLAVVEGQTAFFAVPVAVAISLFVWWRIRVTRVPPVGAMFVLYGYAGALLLVLIWAAINGGALPEFSKLGLID
jgi:hypothetical protein